MINLLTFKVEVFLWKILGKQDRRYLNPKPRCGWNTFESFVCSIDNSYGYGLKSLQVDWLLNIIINGPQNGPKKRFHYEVDYFRS